tara:strand:+ start:845 stop:1189 length:345 start_codon:yes stop_codon:yes gene_type:complete
MSCNNDDVDNIEEQKTTIQSAIIPEMVLSNEEFEIQFEISVSGCWTYSRIEKNENENEILITVFTKNENLNNPEINCLTGIFTEQIIERLSINSIGDKTIRFLNSDLEYNITIE